jgi:hypothetical protein
MDVRVILPVYIKVEPKLINSNNPGDQFKVNITITDVTDLDFFEFVLRYPAGLPPPLLRQRGLPIDDGDFALDYPGSADYQGKVFVNSTPHIGGASGDFTLAIITFNVTNTGNCTLYLDRWKLINSTGGEINATAKAAEFYTPKPVANFTPPKDIVVNTSATFDASSSYDPDGGTINNYFWIWDDSTIPTNTTNPITNHTYTYIPSSGYFNVTLIVTDNEGDTWNITKPVRVVSGRDVAVISIDLCMFAFNETLGIYETAGKLPINVTVKNEGAETNETFDVIIYYTNNSGPYVISSTRVENLPPGNEETIPFTWNIQNVTIGYYNYYNISAYATEVPGEIDLDDNRRENGTVRVYLQGDVNRDDKVDLYDLTTIGTYWDYKRGDPDWKKAKRADLDFDGWVFLYDLTLIGTNLD